MTDQKNIPSKELIEAFKSINLYLELDKRKKLAYVGIKKNVNLDTIKKAIEVEIEEDRGQSLPEIVIDFFNNYFAENDEDVPEKPQKKKTEEVEEKPKPKKDAKKKETSKKKTETKKTSKKDKNASKKNDKKTEKKNDETVKKEKTDKKNEEKSKPAVGVKNPIVAKRNALIFKLISTGKYTKKEIVTKVSEKFTEVTESTISTSIQDSCNPKYNKLEKLTIKDSETGKLSCKE